MPELWVLFHLVKLRPLRSELDAKLCLFLHKSRQGSLLTLPYLMVKTLGQMSMGNSSPSSFIRRAFLNRKKLDGQKVRYWGMYRGRPPWDQAGSSRGALTRKDALLARAHAGVAPRMSHYLPIPRFTVGSLGEGAGSLRGCQRIYGRSIGDPQGRRLRRACARRGVVTPRGFNPRRGSARTIYYRPLAPLGIEASNSISRKAPVERDDREEDRQRM